MLTNLLNMLGTATDVRSLAAIVLGVLTTVVGHNSVIVKALVDGVAGVIVLVDTYQTHKTAQAKIAASVPPSVVAPVAPVPVQVVPAPAIPAVASPQPGA